MRCPSRRQTTFNRSSRFAGRFARALKLVEDFCFLLDFFGMVLTRREGRRVPVSLAGGEAGRKLFVVFRVSSRDLCAWCAHVCEGWVAGLSRLWGIHAWSWRRTEISVCPAVGPCLPGFIHWMPRPWMRLWRPARRCMAGVPMRDKPATQPSQTCAYHAYKSSTKSLNSATSLLT